MEANPRTSGTSIVVENSGTPVVCTATVSDAETLGAQSPSVAVTVICACAPAALGALTDTLTGAEPDAPLAPTLTDGVRTVNVHPAGAELVVMANVSLLGTPAHDSVNGIVVVLPGATLMIMAPTSCADPAQETA